MGAYEHPDGKIRSYDGPGSTWRGDLWPDPKPHPTPPAYVPPQTPQPNWNLNAQPGQPLGSTGQGFEFSWWYFLLFPPAWPFFVAAGVLWAAYKIAVAAALLAVRHRKSITVALAVSGSVALTWTTIHMRGLAEREDGFPLEASTSTRVSQVIPGQHGRQAVDVYTSDQFGSGFYRSLCSLVGASHHYYFSAPAIDNHAKLEHERITGWKLFKVNGGSVRDSQIVVRDGAIVIAGSVTHSILKAERIIVKGNVSRDSTLIVVKPEPPFFPMPARAARHHKA